MFDKLKAYCKRDVYPFHMPGHKRNSEKLGNNLPYSFDITEIDDFDYLHNPTGVIKEINNKASKIYNCNHSFILVNGSTSGVLSAIGAITNYGDSVLVARNCHKSVYNAIEINGLNAYYVLPENNEEFDIHTVITPDSIKKALESHKDIKAVILTSPTYEGFVSNIKEISDICHGYNIPLFVDEAHGAHLGLSEYFPNEAIQNGADIAVLGLHKTLPALTQCAVLNINSHLVDITKLKEQLSIFQTSSPSYILMSSIDKCLDYISNDTQALFTNYHRLLTDFYDTTKSLKHIKVLTPSSDNKEYFDYGKIIISTLNTDINGIELAQILRSKYNLETEMACNTYVLAMTSICDREEGFNRLISALIEIDSTLTISSKSSGTVSLTIPNKQLSVSGTKTLNGKYVDLKQSVGNTALEYVFAYPPGIPILVPGEIIDEQIITTINQLKKANINLIFSKTENTDEIFVSNTSDSLTNNALRGKIK